MANQGDYLSGVDTLMPVPKKFLELLLNQLATRPDSMLKRDEIRKLAELVRERRIISEPSDSILFVPPVPTAVIRRAVESHFPTAFSTHTSGKHYYWFVGDRTNHVLGFASGPEGLGVDDVEVRRRGMPPERTPTGAITWGSVVRMVPGTPEAMQRRGDLLQLATFPNGADTVVAVWARLWGESKAP